MLRELTSRFPRGKITASRLEDSVKRKTKENDSHESVRAALIAIVAYSLPGVTAMSQDRARCLQEATGAL